MNEKVDLNLLDLADQAKNFGNFLGENFKKVGNQRKQKTSIDKVCNAIGHAFLNYFLFPLDNLTEKEYIYVFEGNNGIYSIKIRHNPDFNSCDILINRDDIPDEDASVVIIHCHLLDMCIEVYPKYRDDAVIKEDISNAYFVLSDILNKFSESDRCIERTLSLGLLCDSAEKFGNFIAEKFQENIFLKKQKNEIEKICTVIGEEFSSFFLSSGYGWPGHNYVQVPIKGAEGAYIVKMWAMPTLEACNLKIAFNFNNNDLGVTIKSFCGYVESTFLDTVDINKVYNCLIDILNHFLEV